MAWNSSRSWVNTDSKAPTHSPNHLELRPLQIGMGLHLNPGRLVPSLRNWSKYFRQQILQVFLSSFFISLWCKDHVYTFQLFSGVVMDHCHCWSKSWQVSAHERRQLLNLGLSIKVSRIQECFWCLPMQECNVNYTRYTFFNIQNYTPWKFLLALQCT